MNNDHLYSQVNKSAAAPSWPQSPPANYMPTTFSYNFVNFGLPVHDGAIQHFRLQEGCKWRPTMPATLIISMNSMNLIKVGLPPHEANVLNSITYEMRRALPLGHRGEDDLDYVTHNSLIFMQVDDETNVQLLRNGTHIVMQPAAVLTRWTTRDIDVRELKASIVGLKKCCGKFTPKLHVDSVLVAENDYEVNCHDKLYVL